VSFLVTGEWCWRQEAESLVVLRRRAAGVSVLVALEISPEHWLLTLCQIRAACRLAGFVNGKKVCVLSAMTGQSR
jgi:hypothetical protein